MEKKYVHNGVMKFSDEVLKEKELQYIHKSIHNQHRNMDNDDASSKPRIFIEDVVKILNMRQHFTIKQIKDELNTLIAAVSINNNIKLCFFFNFYL